MFLYRMSDLRLHIHVFDRIPSTERNRIAQVAQVAVPAVVPTIARDGELVEQRLVAEQTGLG